MRFVVELIRYYSSPRANTKHILWLLSFETSGDSCRYGSQIASSHASSPVPEVPESEAAGTWDIESTANGTAEALVDESETAVTPSEPPRMRAPSSAQRGVKCLNYLFAISFVVEIVLLN